jgi:hypothetical protein
MSRTILSHLVLVATMPAVKSITNEVTILTIFYHNKGFTVSNFIEEMTAALNFA